MREIKFRAWDLEKKEWYQPIYEAYKGRLHDLHISLSGRLAKRDLHGVSDESTFPDRYILQQFTGLKDKNGKEIYEGDVVKVGNLKGVYHVQWDKEFSQFRMKQWDKESGYGFGYTKYSIKVIGNIYENPELINP